MNIKLRLTEPRMPNFIRVDITDNMVTVDSLTAEEAEQYAQYMKETFLKHWKNEKEKNNTKGNSSL